VARKPTLHCIHQVRPPCGNSPGRCNQKKIVAKFAIRKSGSVRVSRKFCGECSLFKSNLPRTMRRTAPFKLPPFDPSTGFDHRSLVFCPVLHEVNPDRCINGYMDAAALQKVQVPCFRCQCGRKRRALLAELGPVHVLKLDRELAPKGWAPKSGKVEECTLLADNT